MANHTPYLPSDPLDQLIRLAASYAEHAMRSQGSVPPTFLAQSQEGFFVYHPQSTADARTKDSFANTARMIAIGYEATEVVLILEAWVTLAQPDKPLDLGVAPAQSPDRQECVFIVAEGVDGIQQALLPILRDRNGKFSAFGTNSMSESTKMEGRFAGIMPSHPPTQAHRKMVRQMLIAMGVVPDNMGFDPQWN